MAAHDLQPYPVNVTLAVTKEDIEFGLAQDSYSCAIACAIYRTFPDAMRVRVTSKTIAWSDASTDIRYVYPTPPRVDEKVIRPFDTHQDVNPTRMVLTGGQTRPVNHRSDNRAIRRQARKQKRDNREQYERSHKPSGYVDPKHPASRIYERYVETAEDL